MVERAVGQRRVLDELALVARIEHAIEVLAPAEVDRALELLPHDDVLRDAGIGQGEHRGRRRRLTRRADRRMACVRLQREHGNRERNRRPEDRDRPPRSQAALGTNDFRHDT